MRRATLLLLAGLLAPPAHASDEVADSADAVEIDALEGDPLAAELRAFRDAQARFEARMTELFDDTRYLVDQRERAERQKVADSYDGTLRSLEDLEVINRAIAIDEMRAFLERHPDTRYASHVRFRLADFYFEESMEAWLEATAAFDALEASLDVAEADDLPPPPKLDLSRSIALYERIVDDNQDLPRAAQYEALDAVFYMLGFSFNEASSAQRDPERARVAFEALIAIRPDSELVNAAHLFLGNHWFDQNAYDRAIAEYRSVFEEGPDALYFQQAVYQLAWAYYKLAGPRKSETSFGPDAYDAALELFALLLDASDERLAETGRESDFRPDAVKYVAISFFDVSEFRDDSAMGVAEAYFATIGPRGWEPDVYLALADVLESQARWDEAIAIYRKLQDDPRWWLDPRNADHQMRIVQLHASKRPPDLEASAAARVLLTDRYNLESEWYVANVDHPDAQAAAREYIESSLADVAIEYLITADRSREPDDYLEAARRFQDYIARFPIAEDYYLMQWYLATALYRGGDIDAALQEYASLIASRRHHPYGDGAVYFAMDASLQRLRTEGALPREVLAADLAEEAERQSVPLWVVPRADAVERIDDKESGRSLPVYALSADAAAFVAAADRVLEYPFSEPVDDDVNDYREIVAERRPTIAYYIAQLLWFHQRFDEARPRLSEIIDRHPHRDEAAFAAGLIIDSYQREGDLSAVRLYTRKFMSMSLGEDQSLSAQRQEQFADLLEGVAFKEAMGLIEAGEREAAAEAFLQFTRDFPDSEYASLALFNAGNSYERVGRSDRAGEIFEEYVRRYPTDERAKALYFRIASNYEATFQLERAVAFYEELVKRFPRDPEVADALFNASFLKIGLGDHVGAAQGFEAYGKRFPQAADREEVVFQAGEAWERVSALEARTFYERYLRDFGMTNPDHALAAKQKLADLYTAARNPRRATVYQREILADFKRLSSDGVTLGAGARHAAAKAAFVDLKASYDKFVAARLTGREERDLVLLMETQPAAIARLETDGIAIVSTYGDFEYSTAALWHVAHAYLVYADLGFALEPPKSMSPAEQDVYWEVLETDVFPQFYAVQEKAVARFQAIIRLAREQKRHSAWVDQASTSLNQLDPFNYPQPKREIQGEARAEFVPEPTPLRPPETADASPWRGEP